MGNIKAGQVALIRTTEEPVFVLEVVVGKTIPDAPELEQVIARVRRPVQGEEGVRHLVETFYVQELETQEDKHTRQISEMEELKARFKPGEQFGTQGELFGSN
jgi:hypothetical protein